MRPCETFPAGQVVNHRTERVVAKGLEAILTRPRSLIPADSVVELPGIEPVAETALTCGDAESDDAKQTPNDVRRPADTRKVLTASTTRTQPFAENQGRLAPVGVHAVVENHFGG